MATTNMTSFMSVLRNKYIWIGIVLLIAGGSYWWYSKSTSTSSQVQYITATTEKGTLTSSISASGNVVVDQSSNIDPTITGTVANLAVNVGDKVTKGQFLFNIVNNDLSVSAAKSQTSYEQSLSSLESAKATKKQARVDLDAATSKNKAALKQKFEAAEASVASAQQAIVSAQADLANQRSNAAERRVVSSIDGTVNAVNVKNGDDLSKLSSGTTRQVPIIIGDLSTIKAQVQVNEVDITKVSIGQKVVLELDALEGVEMTGRVEKVDSLGTEEQGVVTYNVTIEFDSLDERIKPEMSVSASIITDVKQNVLLVPASAVKTESGAGYFVEALEDGVPEQKKVEIGVSNDTSTEITSGLKEGDAVVTQTISSAESSGSSSNGGSNSIRIPGITGGSGPR
ncbi:MAG: efflux RND transporter periplasmic adaptor subunit [Parcubacteria group bacterium]|jgi:RND family efflux transporter MFP subunit